MKSEVCANSQWLFDDFAGSDNYFAGSIYYIFETVHAFFETGLTFFETVRVCFKKFPTMETSFCHVVRYFCSVDKSFWFGEKYLRRVQGRSHITHVLGSLMPYPTVGTYSTGSSVTNKSHLKSIITIDAAV